MNIKTIIKFIMKYYGSIRIKNIKRNKLDIKDTHGSNSLIKKYFGFNKFTSMESGVKNTILWYRSNKIYKYHWNHPTNQHRFVFSDIEI